MNSELQEVFKAGDEECISHFFWAESRVRLPERSRDAAIKAKIDRLREHYKMDESSKAFLEANDFVVPLLLQAVDQARLAFGDTARLRLEVLTEGSSEQLFALIGTSKQAEPAMRALAKFDKDWWFQIPAPLHSYLEFSVEYI